MWWKHGVDPTRARSSVLLWFAPVVGCALAVGGFAAGANGQPATWNGSGVQIASGSTISLSSLLPTGSQGTLALYRTIGPDHDPDHDLRASRLTDLGVVVWTDQLVAHVEAGCELSSPVLVTNGEGGGIATFVRCPNHFESSAEVRAVRFDANGTAQWNGTTGLLVRGVSLPTRVAGEAGAVADGRGGVIVTWSEGTPDGRTTAVRAQRIDRNGVAQWGAAGVLVDGVLPDPLIAETIVSGPRVVLTPAFEAIVVWREQRADASFTPPMGTTKTFAAKVAPSGGQLAWGPVEFDSHGSDNLEASWSEWQMVSDGEGGVVVGWVDAGATRQVRAQRIDANGLVAWDPGGKTLGSSPSAIGGIGLCDDGSGGAIFSWPSVESILAKHVPRDGAASWGTIVRPPSGTLCWNTRAIADGSGGATIAWVASQQNGSLATTWVEAQHLSAAGVHQWLGAAVLSSNGELFPFGPGAFDIGGTGHDGAAGLTVGWHSRLFAENFTRLRVNRLIRAPGRAMVSSNASTAATAVLACPKGDAGTLTVSVDLDDAAFGPNPIPAAAMRLCGVRGGTIVVFPQAGVPASTDATAANGFTASFPAAAMGGGGLGSVRVCVNGQQVAEAQVAVRTHDITGDGVVNVSDTSPMSAAMGKCEGQVGYDWRCDLVYWGNPSCVNLAEIGPFSSHLQHAAEPGGGTSMLALPGDPESRADAGSPSGVWLGIAGSAAGSGARDIRFVLPRAGSVRLWMADVAGRAVRPLLDGAQAAGERMVTWDGRDANGALVPSGVYLCVLEANGQRVSRRVSLTR